MRFRLPALPAVSAAAPVLRLGAQAMVLALLVGAIAAFGVLGKTVTLDVDGETVRAEVFGRTVGQVLAAHGVTVGPGDLVVPAPGAVVRDSETIVVRHGREVVVEIDGVPTTVWTTAETVGEVLAELGLRGDVRASASRSTALEGAALRLSTPKDITIAVDGENVAATTSAATVREVLAEAGVVLGEHDRVSVSLDAAAVDGLLVRVSRVVAVTRSATSEIPYGQVRRDDPALARGSERVGTAGRPGTGVITYVAYEADGVELDREIVARSVLTAPVDEVIRVGTWEPPAFTPPDPGTNRELGLQMTLNAGWDEAQFACLDALWSAESGWRVEAHNSRSGAHGIPQALPGSKMASAGADWETSAATQITWGLGYISGRYGDPCGAWAHHQAKNWY